MCAAFGDALTRLTNPALFAVAQNGTRCYRESTVGGLPYSGDDAGMNLAEHAERAYVLFEQSAPRLAVIAVRTFDDPHGPEWQGFTEAVAAAVAADAVIVDLRNATGTDPRGALPLVEALSGVRDLRPLASIEIRRGETAERLRAVRRALWAGARTRDPAPWRQLVGTEPPPEAPARNAQQRGPDEAPVTVIIGGTCEAACELTARMLQTYAGAGVMGRVGWMGRLSSDDVGVLELPAARARVFIPTAAYVLNPRIRDAGGLAGGWHDMRYGPHSEAPYDGLGRVLITTREGLKWRAAERRWVDAEPPPCADYPAYEDYASLPVEARQRLGASPPGGRYNISAVLHLPVERARRYVESCPGLQVSSAFALDAAGRSTNVSIRAETYGALSRLAQSPVVTHINMERDIPPQLD